MSIKQEIKKISKFSDAELQEYLNHTSIKKLHEIRFYTRDIYDNTSKSTGLTDWQYDMLSDTLKERDPNYVMPVGSKVRSGKNRVELPFWLGSMDKIKMDPEFRGMNISELKAMLKEERLGLKKIKDSDEMRDTKLRINKIEQQIKQLKFLDKWTKDNSGPYIFEDKLDGISCLLQYRNNKLKLYTRGDGIIGANISYLSPYLNNIPKDLSDNIDVRGELIMPKEIFKKKWSSKYANPRNLVAGITGAKTIKAGLIDIKFIAYEIVGNTKMSKPSEQFKYLSQLGFDVVRHKIVKKVNLNILADYLISWKKSSPYEIDGIIVQSNKSYKRNTIGNPVYAFAFKMRIGDNLVNAKVVSVVWGLSKWSLLKPRVKFEPVKLMGSTITYASGKSAKFIVKNKIGPGAIVKLTKAGETIPDIIGIVKSASKPDLPKPPCEWKWNASKVDIIGLKNCGEVCIKILSNFFHQLDFKHFGPQTIRKLYGGGVESILDILTVKYDKFRSIGFGEKTSKILLNSITTKLTEGLSLPKVLGASGVLGQHIGIKKATLLLKRYPNILVDQKNMTKTEIYDRISKIEGFGDVLTDTITNNLKWAARFAKALSFITTFKKNKKFLGGVLKGYTVIVTGTLPGYKRKDAERLVEEAGGTFSKNVKKPKDGLNQIIIIANNPGQNKIIAAKKYNIKQYTSQDFFKILKDGI